MSKTQERKGSRREGWASEKSALSKVKAPFLPANTFCWTQRAATSPAFSSELVFYVLERMVMRKEAERKFATQKESCPLFSWNLSLMMTKGFRTECHALRLKLFISAVPRADLSVPETRPQQQEERTQPELASLFFHRVN